MGCWGWGGLEWLESVMSIYRKCEAWHLAEKKGIWKNKNRGNSNEEEIMERKKKKKKSPIRWEGKLKILIKKICSVTRVGLFG